MPATQHPAQPPVTAPETTTYLHLPDAAAFRPSFDEDVDISIVEAREPSVPFYRFLYAGVGDAYRWTDRLRWSDDRLFAYLARPTVRMFPLYYAGTPIGYTELDAAPDEPSGPGTEIAYLGIFPAYHGRGYGKHLLSFGVARAFEAGATRVWLHTSSFDGRHAVANYTARGFVPYRVVTDETGDATQPT